jgi:AcrR family transcriptional regulator
VSASARRLDQQTILTAAAGLVDAEGLGDLTMRRLGTALGVEAMSLYRYFPSRRQLLDALVEDVVLTTATDPELQFAVDDDWRDYLHRLAHGCRQMALSHPKLFPLVATHPTEAPWIRPPIRSLRWVEAFLTGLQDHHFPPAAAVQVYKQFSTFLLGSLLLEVASLGLDHAPDAVAPPAAAADPDHAIAQTHRTVDAEAAAAAMPAGPDATEILDGTAERATTTAQEPAVIAAEPGIALAADAPNAAAVVTDIDVPIVAAVVSTRGLDLSDYPSVSALAGLLAHDSAGQDFDLHLDALIDRFAPLRRH